MEAKSGPVAGLNELTDLTEASLGGAASGYALTTANVLNVRPAPSLEKPPFAKLKRDTLVLVEKRGDKYYVEISGGLVEAPAQAGRSNRL